MLMGVRMYATEERARNAAAAIGEGIYGAGAMAILTPVAGQEEATVKKAIANRTLPGRYVHVGVKALREGYTILSVELPFYDEPVLAVMDSFDPVAIEPPPRQSRRDPAPLSDLLALPVLSKSKPSTALMSGPSFNWFGFPLLSRNQRGRANLSPNQRGRAKLSANQRGKDRSFGFPTLTRSRRSR